MSIKDSRTEKSIRNTSLALLERIIHTVLSFVCRTVFIWSLGEKYLGFNSLFGDVLTLLSLAELGVGAAITYSMFRPMNSKEYKKTAALLYIYKRIYLIIGLGITAVGLCLTPFLRFLISDIPVLPELPTIYILYLLNTTCSYLFSYKKSMLIVDQRSYITSLINIITISIQNLLQIIFLLLTYNFIVYLLIQVIGTLMNNAVISIYVDRQYPWLKKYEDEKVAASEKKDIGRNVRAMFASKLSSGIVTSTDNILISKYVSTITLGLYSNYTLFTTMLRTVLGQIFGALTGSVGNLIAEESKEHIYQTFKRIWYVNFLVASISCIILFTFINPFIQLWAGDNYLLDMDLVFIICVNLYMRLIRDTFIIFADTFGLFVELRPKSIAEACINLVVSLLLVLYLDMGIYGILLGTFISNILTNFWYEPYLLYVRKFNVPYRQYLVHFLKYLVITFLGGFLVFQLYCFIDISSGWISFFVMLVLCTVFLCGLYALVFFKEPEFAYLMGIINKKLKK